MHIGPELPFIAVAVWIADSFGELVVQPEVVGRPEAGKGPHKPRRCAQRVGHVSPPLQRKSEVEVAVEVEGPPVVDLYESFQIEVSVGQAKISAHPRDRSFEVFERFGVLCKPRNATVRLPDATVGVDDDVCAARRVHDHAAFDFPQVLRRGRGRKREDEAGVGDTDTRVLAGRKNSVNEVDPRRKAGVFANNGVPRPSPGRGRRVVREQEFEPGRLPILPNPERILKLVSRADCRKVSP